MPWRWITRQTVQGFLEGIPPDAIDQVNGQQVRKWLVQSLPGFLQERLAARARQGGYRTIEHLLSEPQKQWAATVPYSECTEYYQKRARMLRDALAGALERWKDPNLGEAERLRTGQADYKAVFGHLVSDRHWSDLFYRTIEHAGASEDFSRLDLYLDERPARRLDQADPGAAQQFGELERELALCRDPGALSKDQERHILTVALEDYERLVQGGQSPKMVKALLLDLLWGRTKLAANRNALRVKLSRAYRHWQEADYTSAAPQGRTQSCGRTTPAGDSPGRP